MKYVFGKEMEVKGKGYNLITVRNCKSYVCCSFSLSSTEFS